MRRSPILIFLLVIGTMVAGMLYFIQSPRFARVAKGIAAKYLPKDMGVEGDFSELSVKFFPPGISLLNPKLTVRPHNVVNLPPGSSVEAKRLDLNFRLFQAFTGNIRVHEVVVVDGDVRIKLDRAAFEKRAPKKPSAPEWHWDELLKIQAEAVALKNTKLHIELEGVGTRPGAANQHGQVDLLAKSVRVGQWDGAGGMGYALELEIEGAKAELPMLQSSTKTYRIPTEIDLVRGSVHLNPLGLQLDELFVSASGIEVLATGAMKGNLFSGKSLGFQGNVEGKAALSQVLEALVPDTRAGGKVEFKGSVHGMLDRLEETLRAEGTVRGTEVSVDAWHADEFRVEGAWKAAGAGGELSVTHAVISSREVKRLPPDRGASGGKIEFGPVKVAFPFGSDHTPLTLPITFERAHAHWLGAGILKDVFPLDFRVSGPLKVTYNPAGLAPATGKGPAPRTPRPWEIQTEFSKLNVIEFQLDNQRLGKDRPLHRVLRVPRIVLDGLVRIDPSGIRPDGLSVELPSTKPGAEAGQTRFKLNGKIDYKTGYDFHAIGPVNLADLGEIAENPIRGEGTLALHVHGPTSRTLLDFDTDLTATSYLGLNLGSLKGRITWDDDPSHLIFSDVRLRKGDTNYRGDGKLDLGDANSVNLAFQIPQGDVQDLIQVFGALTQDLWWFPRSLSGPASGSVTVTGGIATRELKIGGRLSGTDWEYGGERFQSVALAGGFDRGRYYVNDFRAIKRKGQISGRISHGPEKEFEWELKTNELTVSDLDHVARLDVPIRGKLAISSNGKGREGAISSTSEIALTSLAVRGVSMPPSNAIIRSQNGVAEMQASALGGQGVLDATYDFKTGGRGSLKGEARRLDFSPVLLLLNPRAIQDHALAGIISGSAQLAFRTGEEDRSTGRVEFAEYLLQKSGASFRLQRPVEVKVNEGSFEIQNASVRGLQGEALLNLRSNRGALDGRVTGNIDISLTEFVTSAIARSTGTAGLDFSIGGTMRAPVLTGKATLNGSSVQMSSLESGFENVTGTFLLKQNVISVQALEADLAGGQVEADGTIEIFATQFPRIHLKGSMEGSKLKVYPFQFAHVKNSSLTLKGEALPYLVEGTAFIDSALSREKVFNQRQGEGLKAIQYMPPAGPQSKNGYPLFKLNISVRADRGILVQNDLFDAEAKGQLVVVNTLEAPRILGTAEFLPGSHMIFKDRTFLIQSANASFDNPTVINPTFNLTATTEVNRVKINLFAQGRLGGSDQMKIELTSNPVLPESELISLLALGLTSNDSKRLSSADRSLVEQGEAASLLLHSLDFNREVRNKTGVEIQLDESTNNTIGTSIFRPQSQNESTAAPRIVIRKRIGSRMELSAKSTVGVGASSQREVNAELRVTPGLSVIGVYDYRETVDATKNTSTPNGNGSYGLDLKIQKRFR